MLSKPYFLWDETSPCQNPSKLLIEAHGQVPLDDADVFVVLGGDGFMLRMLHKFHHLDRPFYGLNFGHVGFLMNAYHSHDLLARLRLAHASLLYPLAVETLDKKGMKKSYLAFNEVSLLRQTHQAAKIEVQIDQVVRIPELVCDGILLATPAGSTAYNLSIQGPILPIGSDLLALTPISPFRPRRWRGALIKNTSSVQFRVLEQEKRPVSASSDGTEVRDISCVKVREDRSRGVRLLFDPHHQLEERIFLEQFQ